MNRFIVKNLTILQAREREEHWACCSKWGLTWSNDPYYRLRPQLNRVV